MTYRDLYPAIDPLASWYLETSTPHRVYVEQCGNPDGWPVLFLHGGPGSACKSYHRQFFNPQHYQAILFDQRGSGRSTPRGETAHNTTADLLADMEAIRKELGIERWLLFGGSWGSTLALLYAQRYPQRVSGMILRGTFLARREDVDWFFKQGVNRLFPDYWSELQTQFTPAELDDLVQVCQQRMCAADPAVRLATAKMWSRWTGKIVTYLSAPASGSVELDAAAEQKMLQDVQIETHYAGNNYFIGENQVLRDIHKMPGVPVHLLHGRRDLTCLLESSWLLHRALPKSQLTIVQESGHLANEPAMIDALVNATDAMLGQLQ